MASEQGYSNQKKKGKAQFKTIHSAGSNSYAAPVIHKSLYAVTGLETVIDGVTDVLGANGQVEFWQLLISGHSAQVGGIVRLMFDSTLPNFEFEVISIVDSDNLLVLPISETKPDKGSDTCIVYGWVSATSDSQGNPIISISPAPIQFLIDGIPYDVSKDSANPANSIPLPVEDLVAQASLADIYGNTMDPGFVDSGNTYATPLGANAVYTGDFVLISRYAAINVGVQSDVASAAGGVKVEFSADGVNVHHFHSTTYSGGNGVGYIFNCEWQYARVVYTNGPVAQTSFIIQTILKQAPVTSSLYTLSQAVNSNMFAALGRSIITGETTGGGGGYANVKVNPSGALTVEADVTGTVSVSNFPATQAVSGSVAITNLPATQPVSGTVDVGNFPATQAVSGTVSVSNFPATQAVTGTFFQATQPVSAAALPLPSGASTLAEQQTQTTAIGSLTETAPATDTASSGLNGRLQRIAQRITSLIALIPASLGQETMANSFAVTLASDQSALSTTQTALVSSYQEITNLTITAQTFTAPVGAKWCKIYAEDTNVADIRVRIGGTATVTSGLQLQPGRSEDFNAVGNISVIAESGTNQRVNVHFGV